jgi:hypothetical protein
MKSLLKLPNMGLGGLAIKPKNGAKSKSAISITILFFFPPPQGHWHDFPSHFLHFPPSGRGNLASGLLCGVFSGGKMEEEMTGTRG